MIRVLYIYIFIWGVNISHFHLTLINLILTDHNTYNSNLCLVNGLSTCMYLISYNVKLDIQSWPTYLIVYHWMPNCQWINYFFYKQCIIWYAYIIPYNMLDHMQRFFCPFKIPSVIVIVFFFSFFYILNFSFLFRYWKQ